VVRSLHGDGDGGAARPTQVRQTPVSLSPKKRVALIGLACRPPAEVGKPVTHWSAEDLRDAFAQRRDGADVSADTIARELAAAELQPHRQRYFLTSKDPAYDEKLADIVGLYLDPPAGATILCLDEKPSIQAVSRKHEDLPMRVGHPVAYREFEYVRHGVLNLFAAFNVRTGRVLADVQEQKTRAQFIELIERCAWYYRQGPVHCVLDNAAYHFTPEVQAWLREHPRFVFHFTPKHASWLNQVECWFSILSKKVLRRGSFDDKKALASALTDFIVHWNANAHPFAWAYGKELIHGHLRRSA